jgi:hypothetical protein
MKNEICPKFENCPIYSGEAFKRQASKEVYQSLYCKAGAEKFKSCKRYIVSEKTGKPVPPTIMPNAQKSIEEIVEAIK